MPEPQAPDDTREALAAIASLLAPAHPDVAEQVLHAHDRPHDYVSAFGDRLADRGSTSRSTTSRGSPSSTGSTPTDCSRSSTGRRTRRRSGHS